MELTEYQLLYIQTVYDYFREHLQWPTFRQVQGKILPTHRYFRVIDVAKSIEDNQAAHFYHNLDSPATITLKEIHQLPEAKQDLADVLKVMCYSVEKYITEDKERVRVTSEEISQNLHFDETASRKVFQLLGLTTGIIGSNGNSPDDNTWYFEVADSAIDYLDLTSIDDYFARRDEKIQSYQASSRELKPNAIVVSEHGSNEHPVFAKEMGMDKVKVLFLAANPLGTDRLKLDEEIRAITEKVYASEYRDSLQIESSWAIRPDDLLQLLNRYRPYIVHFSGHGSQTGEIILVDNTGSPKVVSTMALTEAINCVVGMNDAIGDEAAIIFAASFYRALGFGRSVQEAFDQGKVALLLEGIPEENTPELLVRTGVNPSQVFLVEQPIEKQQINQEQQRRSILLRKLKTEYIISHPNVSERILIGTEPLPKEWVEKRLGQIGETWRQDAYLS